MKFKYIIQQIAILPIHIIGTFCYILSYFYPKSKDVWIHGAWYGEKFCDNSMYFYKYMLKYHPEIKSVWITKNKEVYDHLKNMEYPVEYANSVNGIKLHLKAEVAVLTSGKYDVNQNFLSSKTKAIQLWHGIPLKKIVFDTYLEKIYDKTIKYLFFIPVLKNLLKLDLVISTSEFYRERFAKAFRLDPNQVPVTGYPRNDIFFNSNNRQQNQEKTIFYAPTLRNEGINSRTAELISSDNLANVNERLKKSNAKLFIKLHFKEESLLKNLEFSNIEILKKDPLFDIQEFLCITDILITDYSSVYFDYLLLGRPIIYFAYDLEDYIKKDRGFYDDYESVTPGPVVTTWEGIVEEIENNLGDMKRFSEEREILKANCWDFIDGKSSERVYKEIKKIL